MNGGTDVAFYDGAGIGQLNMLISTTATMKIQVPMPTGTMKTGAPIEWARSHFPS